MALHYLYDNLIKNYIKKGNMTSQKLRHSRGQAGARTQEPDLLLLPGKSFHHSEQDRPSAPQCLVLCLPGRPCRGCRRVGLGCADSCVMAFLLCFLLLLFRGAPSPRDPHSLVVPSPLPPFRPGYCYPQGKPGVSLTTWKHYCQKGPWVGNPSAPPPPPRNSLEMQNLVHNIQK
jgi:hypothetical protein